MPDFPQYYKILNKQVYSGGKYSIVPIRYGDRISIMKWRNEQLYHLRQARPLTIEEQENYFNSVIAKLFEAPQPNQILFSYLENRECIGYGGLVHINWIDRNAEISFLIDEKPGREYFHKHWGIYLDLIEEVAFEELKLHKIYTYAFDLRSHLYKAIEVKGYAKEAVLKEHCLFNGEFKNVVIHSKINRNISIRLAQESDAKITYEWVNDEQTRKNSFSSEPILFENHEKWWRTKLKDRKSHYYICEVEKKSAGIVRFDKNKDDPHFTVGINIAPEYRGKGLGENFLKMACREFFRTNRSTIDAYIKRENIASIKSFEKANFNYKEGLIIEGAESVKYERKYDDQ